MATNDLTRKQAETRKQQISNVKYHINLSLNKTDLDYKAQTIMHFDFNDAGQDSLMIDFITKEITSLSVNGKEVTDYNKDDYWLYIPSSMLTSGSNEITIHYTNTYNNTGSGFHRFVDSEDSEVYIHSDFEPYDAHRLFPCFDQPDLKATYKLTVIGPKDWAFIHNTNADKESVEGNYKTINFKETALFSTYIFALCVGPHQVWSDQYKNIPMKIYCRKSLAKYLDADNIFDITKESFEFMEEYFDIPYPYGKYDQIFVPEFNFGAMENVACVTFTEHYIFRSKKLYNQYLGRSNTVFHEMVHMWFGNLVTMKWWNDLWLNESFADYLSYYAMSKGKLFPDSFEFLLNRKEWAYMQDQLSTTHPIVGSAVDTADAFASFDGISYSKGASVLKQLTYFIGEEKFRNGIRIYLKKFYEKNTVLDDFLSCMSEASGIDIISWSKKWLETTGVNTLRLDMSENSCFVKQLPSENNNELRSHAIMYEGYDTDNGKAIIKESGKLFIKGNKTDLELKSSSKFILLNAQDHDYVKIRFRDEDLQFIFNNLNSIEDRFTQRIIWGNLWQMLRDNALSPMWYLELVEKFADIEKDPTVLQGQMLQKASGIKNVYLTDKNRQLWSERLYDLSFENLKKGQNDQFQISWFDLLLNCAESEKSIQDIRMILDGEITFNNLTIDQEKRWDIVTKLCAYNSQDSCDLISKEEDGDPGDLGKKRAFMARVAMPNIDVKSEYWDMFVSSKQEHSSAFLRYGMEGFFWHKQKDMLQPYADKYFDNLKNIFETKDVHYSSNYSAILFPMTMNAEKTLNQTEDFINTNENLPKLCKKGLIENADHLKRRIPILDSQK